jgi:hypothetical protein
MAKQGTFAAYQQLQPTQDLSQTIQYWNQSDQQDKQRALQEDALAERKRQAQDQKKQKLFDAYGKYIKPGAIELESYDAKLANFFGTQVNEMQAQLLERLMDNPDDIQTQLQLSRLQALPQRVKAVSDVIQGQYSQYQELRKNDSVHIDPMWENLGKDGFANVQVLLDPDTQQPVIVTQDTNNDGVLDMNDEYFTFEQITRELPEQEFIKKYHIDTMAREYAKEAPLDDVTRVTGLGRSVQVKDINPDKLEREATSLYFVDEETPSPMAISHLIQLGMDLTPENALKAKEIYKSKVKDRISTIQKETDSANVRIAAQREARLGRAAADKAQAGSLQPLVQDEQLAYEEKEINGTTVNVLPYTFNDGKAVTISERGAEKDQIQNLLIDDNDNVYAEVFTIKKGKEETLSFGEGEMTQTAESQIIKRETRQLSKTEVGNFARMKNNEAGERFKTNDELIKFMKEKAKPFRGQQASGGDYDDL